MQRDGLMTMRENFEDETTIGEIHAAYPPFDAATRQRLRDQLRFALDSTEPISAPSPRPFQGTKGRTRDGTVIGALVLGAFGSWRRKRVSAVAAILAIAVLGVGTSGLAAAAIQTIQTHLFSAPPPSPQAAVWVGRIQPPLWGGCAPRATTAPVVAPDGRRFAQLDSVPDGYGDAVAATFPPCLPEPPRPGVVEPKQPADLAWENITTVSVVRYRGPSGVLEVTTARATDEGMRRGLYLGNPVGTLADGSQAFTLTSDVRWVKDGLIVSVSGDASLDRLKSIAADVVLK